MAKLIDSFGRKIDYLRISVTDRCNLRCVYCMPKCGVILKEPAEILSFEEIERITRIFISLGIEKIRLTGGEPLVRRNILGLIKRLSQINSISDLSLTTNGILLKDFASSLKVAGIKRINISLDTLQQEKFKEICCEGNLDDVLNAIDLCLRLEFSPLKVNVVLIRSVNDSEILDFTKLTEKLPIIVRFIEFMPLKNDFWDKDKIFPNTLTKEIIQDKYGALTEVKDVAGNGPAEYFRLRNFKGKIGFISPLSSCFCDSCSRLRLTCDGYLKLCLSQRGGLDLRQIIRNTGNDNRIAHLIKEIVALKPKAHNFLDVGKEAEKEVMCSIGG